MPHVLWELQGQQALKVARAERASTAREHVENADNRHARHAERASEYDTLTADLVNYLVFMGEPARQSRDADRLRRA